MATEIKAENLSFGYTRNSDVLRNINFSFSNSDVIALVGVSGSGKSTLLRLISGNLMQSKKYKLNGDLKINDITSLENTKAGNIGFMFQEATLLPYMTVLENILLPLKIKGLNNTEFALELLDKIGLAKYKDYLPDKLSGGMKTRVSLARTFVTKPKLILLDEPFGSLDVKWKDKLYRELEMLRQEFSATIFIVTHDIREAILLSNDILILNENGTISKQIKVSEGLPRVFDQKPLVNLQDEIYEIEKTILEQ